MVRLAGQHKVFEDEIRVLCDTIGHNRERLTQFPGIPEHCKVEHVASVRRERGRRHSFYLGFHVFIDQPKKMMVVFRPHVLWTDPSVPAP